MNDITFNTTALTLTTATTQTINGMTMSSAGALNNTGTAGTINYAGLNLTSPSATTGVLGTTILDDGLKITQGSYTVTNTNGANGGMNGIDLIGGTISAASGISGTINDIKFSTSSIAQTTTGVANMNGLNLSSAGALSQSIAAGAINWNGLTVTMPNVTQSTGTVTAQGVYVRPGLITTGGTESAFVADMSTLNVVGATTGLKIPWAGTTTSLVPVSIDFGGFTAVNNGVDGVIKMARASSISSSACVTATAQGLVFINDAGTQIGHFCTDSANNLKFFGAATTAGTDVAENYSDPANNLVAGDVVVLDKGGKVANAITETSIPYDPALLGIISTDPGVTLSGINESNGATNLVNPKVVAIVGRVPTYVSTENGPIVIGDYVTSSTKPGVAMKATKPGVAIGIALENYSGDGVGNIEVFTKLGYYNGQSLAQAFSSLDATSATFNTSVLAQLLTSQSALATSTNLSELFTDRVTAGLEVITPQLIAGTVETNTLTTSTGNSLTISLGSGQTFAIKEGAVVALALDASGNAVFSGKITGTDLSLTDTAPKALTVSGGATFGGGLTVDTIGAVGDLLTLTSDTEFIGTPYFNADTAGFAVIKQGAQSVNVTFTKPYLEQPIVNATITLGASADSQSIFNGQVQYLVNNVSTNGFTIVLNKNAPTDIQFSWTAFAVKNPNTFFSLITPPAPDPSASTVTTPDPSSTPTPSTPDTTSGSGSDTSAPAPSTATPVTPSDPITPPTPDPSASTVTTPDPSSTPTPSTPDTTSGSGSDTSAPAPSSTPDASAPAPTNPPAPSDSAPASTPDPSSGN